MMIGFESASQVVLDYMGKNYDPNYAQVIMSRFNNAGIDVRLPVMNGFPGESTSDFLVTCAFVLRYMDSEGVNFSYSAICIVYEGTIICEYPRDFCIKETQLIGDCWQQCDEMNTFPVRQLRRSLVMHCMKRAIKDFDADKLILSLDFNKPEVAIELLRLVYLLGMANNRLSHAQRFVESISSDWPSAGFKMEDKSKYRMLCQRAPGFEVAAWLAADKNCESKKVIIRHIYSELDALRESLDKTSHIDCHAFKNRLYPSKAEDADSWRSPFGMLSIRLTEYDSGQFVILEGIAWDGRNNVPVSTMWAKAGDRIVDFHYGMKNKKTDSSSGLLNIRFWGKIKKSYIGKVIYVIVQIVDGKCFRHKVLLDI
jgi:hypothetical protein